MSSRASSDAFNGVDLIGDILKTDQSPSTVFLFSLGRLLSSARFSSTLTAAVLLVTFTQLLPFVFTVETWAGFLTDFVDVIEKFRLQYLLAKASYSVYIAVVLVVLGVGIVTLGWASAVAWISRDEPHDADSTAAHLLTGCTSLLGKAFYVSTLGLALGVLDCSSTSSSLKMYPDIVCWTGSHVGVTVAGGALAVVIVCLALAAVFTCVGLSPTRTNALASPRFAPVLTEVFWQTVLVVGAVAIPHDSAAWPAVQVVSFGAMWKSVAQDQPFFARWVNRVESGMYAVLTQAAAVALIGRIVISAGSSSSSDHGGARSAASVLVFALMPVAALLGLGAGYVQELSLNGLRRYRKIAEEDSVNPREPLRFSSPVHYEVSTRFVYATTAPPEAEIELSENILLGGISAEPNCVWLKLVHATFLTEIRRNVARSEALLNECRGKSPSLTERYLITLREQLNNTKIQTAGTSSLEASAILVAGISKVTLKLEQYSELHRTFYKAISGRQVNPDRVSTLLGSLADLREELQEAVTRLLKQNKSSVPVLRLYGNYLNHVRNEAAKGCAFLAEAERIEAEILEARRRAAMFDVDMNNIDDAVDRIITIDRFGTVFRVTTRLARMFGFQHPSQLLGQNVCILTPPVHCVQHDGYLHRYHEGTKPARVVNSERAIMAQNAKGYTFPVCIYVCPIQGASHTSEAYVARIVPITDEEQLPEELKNEEMTFATNDAGQIVSFNKQFLELMDTTHKELYGTEIAKLIPSMEEEAMTIYDLPDKMVTTLTFAGVTHKKLSVAFSLMSNSKLRYLVCTVAKPEVEIVVSSGGGAAQMAGVPAVMEKLSDSDDGSESETDAPSSTSDASTPPDTTSTAQPQIVMLKDLMGVSTEDLSQAVAGKYTQTFISAAAASPSSPHLEPLEPQRPRKEKKRAKAHKASTSEKAPPPDASPAKPFSNLKDKSADKSVRKQVAFGSDDIKPSTPNAASRAASATGQSDRPRGPAYLSSALSQQQTASQDQPSEAENDESGVDDDAASSQNEDSVIMGHEEEYRIAAQHDAIEEALSSDKLVKVLSQPANVIRVCLFLCLISHGAWFGKIWSSLEQTYLVPEIGALPTHIPSIPTQDAFNLGFAIKQLMSLAFNVRVLRSGSPQGLNGYNIVSRLAVNIYDVRLHTNELEDTPTGAVLKETFITVRDYTTDGKIITRELSLWNTLQQVISCSLSLTATSAVQNPPPREWMFIMLNAPSALYDALEPIYDELLDTMDKDIHNTVDYVSIASAIVIFLAIVLVAFGLRPMISRMTQLRVMLMHLFLSVPRGTARGLAKKETEAPTDWSNEKQKSSTQRASDKKVAEGDKSAANDDDEDDGGSDDGSLTSGAPPTWGNLGPASANMQGTAGGGGSRIVPGSLALQSGGAGGGPRANVGAGLGGRSTLLDLTRKKKAEAAPSTLSERFPILRSLRELVSLRGEEHQFLRGRETCRFRVNVQQKYLMFGALVAFVCFLGAAYIMFYIVQNQFYADQHMFHSLFSVFMKDFRARFWTHEYGGGWDLYPRADMLKWQQESVVAAIAKLELFSPLVDSYSELTYFWRDQECFIATCAQTDKIPSAKARGFYSLHYAWTLSATRLVEAAAIRNVTIPGTSTTFVPLPNVTDSLYAIWAGANAVSFGFLQMTDLKADSAVPPDIFALQILFLLLTAAVTIIIEFVLLRKQMQKIKNELKLSGHVLAEVPDYLGIASICERERKKTFGLI